MKEAMKDKRVLTEAYREVVKLSDIMQSHSMSNIEHVVPDMYDIL